MSRNEHFVICKQNGRVLFHDWGGYETRNPSTIWCVYNADKIYNWPNFSKLHIFTHDYQRTNELTYSNTKNDYSTMAPDFNFCNWKEVGLNDYEECTKQMDNVGKTTFEINKVGWIGNLDTNEIRKKLFDIGKANTDLFDIMSVNWQKTHNQTVTARNYISMQDLVQKYSILLDIEGYGYSGRLKYLFWSHRPVLLVDRPHKEFFYEHLIPWEHYIPVERDLEDLVEKTKWCLDNYEKAKQIAENAFTFAQEHLTRNGAYKQWNRIIMNHVQNTKI